MKSVIVFSQPGWMFCDQAKEYLSQKRVDFQDRDITRDPAALQELKKLGYMTTPVIQVKGHTIVGFDQEKIDAALTATWWSPDGLSAMVTAALVVEGIFGAAGLTPHDHKARIADASVHAMEWHDDP